jgi:hypothetical protein
LCIDTLTGAEVTEGYGINTSVLDTAVGRALLKKWNDVALAVREGSAEVGVRGGNGATIMTV